MQRPSSAEDPRAWLGGISMRTVGMLALVGNILCWGATPVLLRQLTVSVDAWTANGFRYPLAAVLYWPILWSAWRKGHITARLLRNCLLPAFFSLGGQIFWALAPYYLEASAIAFYVRLGLVWALIGAMILFVDERLLLKQYKFYLGLLLMLVGFVGMSLPQLGNVTNSAATGVVIMVLCGMFFGCYGVSIRYFLTGVDPLLAFGIVCQLVALGTLAMIGLGNPSQLIELDLRAWMLMVAAAVLGIALGHVLLYTAVQRLGASVSSAAQTATPLATVLIAFVVLGERLTMLQWLAGLGMLVGAVTLLRSQKDRHPAG